MTSTSCPKNSSIVDAPVARRDSQDLPRHSQAVTQQAVANAPILKDVPEDEQAKLAYYQDFRINFGKYRGKKLGEVARKDVEGYLSWLRKEADKKNSALSVEAAILTRMAELYFEHLDGREAVAAEEDFNSVA